MASKSVIIIDSDRFSRIFDLQLFAGKSPFFKKLLDNSDEPQITLNTRHMGGYIVAVTNYMINGVSEFDKFNWWNLMDLKRIAMNWELSELQKIINDAILKKLTPQNMCDMLEIQYAIAISDIRDQIHEYVDKVIGKPKRK